MRISIRQLKNIIKEQVDEARQGDSHKAKLKAAIKEFLSVEFANAGVKPGSSSHEAIVIVQKVDEMAEEVWHSYIKSHRGYND